MDTPTLESRLHSVIDRLQVMAKQVRSLEAIQRATHQVQPDLAEAKAFIEMAEAQLDMLDE